MLTPSTALITSFGYPSTNFSSNTVLYGMDDWAIKFRSPAEAKRIFPLASVSRLVLGPTQVSFPGGKAQLGRDADHSPPSCAKVKNE
jgi:hypothetical protein